jgi:hypothetical protein
LAGTTFPQATRSCHAEILVSYETGQPEVTELRSPNSWWPVEQDYLVDDYVFGLDPRRDSSPRVDWRVDLKSGNVRALYPSKSPGRGAIDGGSAFVVTIDTDPQRTLRSIELHTRLYGVVLAWMGLTLEFA